MTGTPSFVIVMTNPANPAMAKRIAFFRGALLYEDFTAAIEVAVSEHPPFGNPPCRPDSHGQVLRSRLFCPNEVRVV